MAIDKIQTAGLGENIEIGGTEAAKMPVGTTAERANVQAGDIRFNSTLSLMEYYDGTNWKAIDSPPTITSISPDNFDTAGDTITISGSNFQSGATVKIIASDNQELTASSVTFTNSSSISFDITSAMVADDNDPYDVVVTNPSGLSGTIADALDFAPEPAFTIAAGTLYTIYDSGRGSISVTTGATSSESDATITYAVTTGALPSGLSISSSTGTITGSTSAVGSDTTVTFTITATATDGSGNTTINTRQYSIIQKAPTVTSYTSTGSGTFSVPTGTTAVDVLVVAGGGGSGNNKAAGAGAGGLIYRPAFPVTPGGSVSYTVGAGGAASTNGSDTKGGDGQDSVWGTLTAKGGGGGASDYNNSPSLNAAQLAGGSGGGSARGSAAGTGNQPQQPGDSGTYGFGNPGGTSAGASPGNYYVAAGGGGAGAAGESRGSGDGRAGDGGVGKQYDISGTQVYYAGGGGGSGYTFPGGALSISNLGQGGQGGGSDAKGYSQGGNGNPGTANRGGGAGGANGLPAGGSGGSGIVIVKY